MMTVRVGKLKFVEKWGIGIPEDLDSEAPQKKAQTVVGVAADDNAAGLLAIADHAEFITEMRKA